MSYLRRISTRHLLLLCASAVVAIAAGTALAVAAGSGGPKPPPKALAPAVHDALVAPEPAGVTARVRFTNHLVDAGGIEGAGPLISGATGRLWASADGRFRLELQSDRGDAQIVSNGHEVTAYDASSNTVYRARLPVRHADRGKARQPTLGRVEAALARLGRRAVVAGPAPGDVAGRPTYTVRLAPRQRGGRLAAAALAWDAARGLPLRLALYARGQSAPVLELTATDVSYGPVAAGALDVSPPAGAKTVDLTPKEGRHASRSRSSRKPVVGVAAVRRAAGFALAAPPSLAGRPRQEVRLLGRGGRSAALVTYGRDLSAILVLERTVKATDAGGRSEPAGALGHARLPTVSIGGVTGHELDTALGTAVVFERGGVSYTVLGSVAPGTARAAARGL